MRIQAIRGMHDLLPAECVLLDRIEQGVRQTATRYGYSEIRTPILERTELFKRAIGEVTDIVEKEMYSFDDRNGDSLTLRPDGTAGITRACLEHGLVHNQTQRFWYRGPMFRHERPQKGRYRQFHQVGIEAYGMNGPDIDFEVILLSTSLWRQFEIEGLELQINSLGESSERDSYRADLELFLEQHKESLDEDSRRRLTSNPLRILDSKNEAVQQLLLNGPSILNYLGNGSRVHFEQLCAGLDAAGISYRINPRLVRGLDYYSRTVFEWVTDRLGAQGTVCAGGRYDGLVTQLGGSDTSAIGFAIGVERLMALIGEVGTTTQQETECDLYIVAGEATRLKAQLLAQQIRDTKERLKVVCHCGAGGFKAQFKKADRSGALLALILGEDESATDSVGVKFLREEREQELVLQKDLPNKLQEWIA